MIHGKKEKNNWIGWLNMDKSVSVLCGYDRPGKCSEQQKIKKQRWSQNGDVWQQQELSKLSLHCGKIHFYWVWSRILQEHYSAAGNEARGRIGGLKIKYPVVVCGNKMPTTRRCNRWFYCISYCLLNMFRALLCLSSGAREYYTGSCCLWYLVLWF
jgi:hypothetical protein